MTAASPASRVTWDPAGPRRAARLSTDRPARLDLAARLEDLRRIARSLDGWRRCLAVGWTPEELEAELVARLAARQRSGERRHRGEVVPLRGAYDPARASLAKYLWTFCRSNLHQLWEKAVRAQRQRQREQEDPEPWEDDDHADPCVEQEEWAGGGELLAGAA